MLYSPHLMRAPFLSALTAQEKVEQLPLFGSLARALTDILDFHTLKFCCLHSKTILQMF